MGKHFRPMRGLLQGNLLSTYLFLICSEGLSSLMRLAAREDSLKGVKVYRRDLSITHLLFAGDCILFGDATVRRANNLNEIYENMEYVQVNILTLKSQWHILAQMSLSKFGNKLLAYELWKVNLPSKTRILVWMTLNNYLPTFSNLFQRKI
ncbi:hypothetical protein V6Z11_D11G291000 [Gossypium hirsutum]